MNLSIKPSKLTGHITIPASKSIMHRALICAALSEGVSTIENIYLSKDIVATIESLRTLGAEIKVSKTTIAVVGIKKIPARPITIDCEESGSTIRFLIPIAAALGCDATFTGKGKLVSRPLSLYQTALADHGVDFSYDGLLPAVVHGKLQGGDYTMQGNVSSQFITGLLFSLPLLCEDSTLTILPPFESKGYVDITLACLEAFGVTIAQNGLTYQIKGNQRYTASNYTVESDYSQAAFFLTGCAFGNDLTVGNFEGTSVQGDAQIVSILNECGFSIGKRDGNLSVTTKGQKPFAISAENIPDLVPILCILATALDGVSYIHRVERLRIKESDRIASTMSMVQALGGHIAYQDDCISVKGCQLHGGIVDCQNDHRIAMAAAIAATICDGHVTLKGADCVEKSYPTFWEDYQRLGGCSNVIDLD